MNGRARRTERILGRIREAALQLFSARGVDQVAMDEIAALANVSKVTIYKYFHSKEALRKAVIDLYVDDVLASTEEILDSDLDFLEKLRVILLAQVEKPPMVSDRYLFDMLERDAQAEGRIQESLKKIIFRLYEQGKQEGYIAEDLPFEVLYLYSEIYQAGVKAKLAELEPVLSDRETLQKLNNVFFFGIIKQQRG